MLFEVGNAVRRLTGIRELPIIYMRSLATGRYVKVAHQGKYSTETISRSIMRQQENLGLVMFIAEGLGVCRLGIIIRALERTSSPIF